MGQPIQFRRGNKPNLPNLNNGEPAFVQDEKDLYVGTPNGNQLVGGKSVMDKFDQVESQLAQKVYYFNTVSEMKSSRKLKPGDACMTVGYHYIFDGGGATYYITDDIDAGRSGGHDLDNGYKAKLVVTGKINVKQFGAKGDFNPSTGVGTDDTDAFNEALYYYIKTSPHHYSGWGIGTIEVPKGNYLINGTVSRTSPIGVVFEGESEYATNIIRTVDTGTMFFLKTYISVAFEKMSFEHIPQNEDSKTWTTTLFELDGMGGGKMLQGRNLNTRNFDTIIKHTNTINEDVNNFQRCRFHGCNTFLDSENSQAVINTYSDCSWSANEQVFHVAGSQNTLIESGNIITGVPFIRYKPVSGKFNDRGFTLINCKWEWTNVNTEPNSPPKVVDARGSYIHANITMIDCTVDGGAKPAEDALWADINAQCRIKVIGGNLTGKLRVKGDVRHFPERGNYIIFENVDITPDSIIFDSEGAALDDVFPPISFENCRGIGHNPINLTLTSELGTTYVNPARTVVLGIPNKPRSVFYPDTTTTIEMSSFGQPILLRSIKVNIKRAVFTGGSINVYSDRGKTNLIGTLELSTESQANNVYDIPLLSNNVVTDEGIFIEFVNTGGSTTAVFICDYVSV